MNIKKNFKEIFNGPSVIAAIAPFVVMQGKVSQMRRVKRIFLSVPALLAGTMAMTLLPFALLTDRVVKPLFFSLNRDSTLKPLILKPATSEKVKAWALVIPKFLGVVPLAVLAAAILAVAIPILFIPSVGYTMAGKSLSDK